MSPDEASARYLDGIGESSAGAAVAQPDAA
jgi:hypothetical protein